MNIDIKNFPELTYLFDGFFHQDWQSDHGTADAVLAFYKENSSEEEHLQLEKELSMLLSNKDLTEQDYQSFLKQCHCEYLCLNEWPSSRDWMIHIKEQIA
jgi:hypothetical protein